MGRVGRVSVSSTLAVLAATVALPALLRGQEEDPAAVDARGPTLSDQGAAAGEEFGTDPRAAFASAIQAAGRARASALADAEAAYDRRVSAFRSASQALTADARRRIEAGPLREARGVLNDSLRLAEIGFDREVEQAVEGYGGPALAVFSAANDIIAEVNTDYEVYAAVVDAAEAAFESELERLRSAQSAVRRADPVGAAYEARAVAGIEAARLTRVHSPGELADVTRSLRNAALAAIAEVETKVLAGLPRASIVEAFRSAANSYAEPKLLAIGATLEAIEEEYANAVKAAETGAREARTRARSVQKDLEELLAAHESDYERAVREADGALQDVIVRYYSKDIISRESKFGGARREAASAHRGAIEAALEQRREAVSRKIPEAEPFLAVAQGRLYQSPNRRIYGGSNLNPQDVVQAMRGYKNRRASADAKFGEEVSRAYARAQEQAIAESLEAAKASAERGRVSGRGEVVVQVVSARGRPDRLQGLEDAIRAALRAAGNVP